jgi:hypothetical protein
MHMTTAHTFPYFNQDFDLWGDTIEEVVGSYREGTSSEQREALRNQIDRFIDTHSARLDDALSERYGFDFSPEPWGHTALSFLREVQRLVADDGRS